MTAVIRSIDDGSRGIVILQESGFCSSKARPQRHQANIPAYSADANAVVSHGSDDSGHVSAVKILILYIVILLQIVSQCHIAHLGSIDKVPTAPIIHITIPIVIYPIIRDLPQVFIYIAGQIRMVYQHTAVDYANYYLLIARAVIPCGREVYQVMKLSGE